MKPYFSLIIPYHNAGSELVRLLISIKKSIHAPFLEVIIVDDASKPACTNLTIKKVGKTKFPLKILRLKKNRGPAIARNTGAAAARGTYLVFLDGDVILFPDTLANLWKLYANDADITAVTGVWTKEQETDAFFPNFKALRDWSYWINERESGHYYYLFSTRIASIKRDVFLRLGGFDEHYAGPLVEDIEFTYRIATRYAVIFAPTVRVRHEFEGFWPIAKKYFWRTYYWTKLFAKRKKFDPVATTLKEAVSAMTGVFVAGMTLLFLFSGYFGMTVFLGAFTLWLFSIGLHVLFIRKFLGFVMEEKGLAFAVQSFLTGIVLYCFIVSGAVWGKMRGK